MNTLRVNLNLQRGADFRLHIDTEIPLQGITGLYGPSGCGKTSLLRGLAGLLPLAAGSHIQLADTPWVTGRQTLPCHRRGLGFVFQEAQLFPQMTVAANLRYATRRRGGRPGPDTRAVCSWLKLPALLERPVAGLSRGQQQRVAIARALLSHPALLLLDEPLANIDHAGRREILQRLEHINRQWQIPMLYVSHDMEEHARLAQHLLLMRDGEITAQGPTIELCSRLDLALAQEEQAAAIVVAEFRSTDPHYGLSTLQLDGQTLWVNALDAEPGTPIRLRVPARDVSLCLQPPQQTSILNVLRATIVQIEEAAASRLLLRLQLGEHYLLARVTRKSLDKLALRTGLSVYVQIKSVALLSAVGD